jgi:hypothetical protein
MEISSGVNLIGGMSPINLQRGLVLGSNTLVKRLEQKLERSLACLNPGRPKKEKQ